MMSSMVNVGECYTCKCELWIPAALYEAANASPAISFCCAYGHSQHFTKTPHDRELDKLKRERDEMQRLRDLYKQRCAQKDDEILAKNRQLSATKGQMTKLKKRTSGGVCPCCTRTFSNMARHMKTQHPEFNPQAAI